jgi:hypothetical protein
MAARRDTERTSYLTACLGADSAHMPNDGVRSLPRLCGAVALRLVASFAFRIDSGRILRLGRRNFDVQDTREDHRRTSLPNGPSHRKTVLILRVLFDQNCNVLVARVERVERVEPRKFRVPVSSAFHSFRLAIILRTVILKVVVH